MLKQFKYKDILARIKQMISKFFREILEKLSKDFGGVSYFQSNALVDEPMVNGVYTDCGNFIKTKIIPVRIDIEESRAREIVTFFPYFKITPEKPLNGKQIGISVQPIARCA